MKELDFDELDRAVNSLMTDVPKTEVPTAEKSTRTLEITPTLSETATPSFDKLENEVKATTVAPPVVAATAPPLAARRGGRFMDVVHPSSDMKKPTPATRPVSRQGINLTPRPSAARPIEMPLTVSSDVPPVSSPSPAATQPEPAAPVSEWPDPLEMPAFKGYTAAASETEPTTTPLVEAKQVSSSEEVTSEPVEEERAPLTSPFLPGTKVEKRPLGSSAPSEEPDHTPVLGAGADVDKTVDDATAQLPAEPGDVEPQLPEELQGDLIAIEADTSDNAVKPESLLAAGDTPESHEKLTATVSEPAVASTGKSEVSSGPTSIPQQYREEANTNDSVSGAIYDTDTYHQALAHPVKKKSGWLWVIWIVLILVVGAGAGAALYFSGIV